MPQIIDYSLVLPELEAKGFKCLYYNSGAFGFANPVPFVGWIGRPDRTIRPEIGQFTQQISAPFSENSGKMFGLAWQRLLPGKVWVMPKSHWHYELHFGNKDWLGDSLRAIGIDPELLRDRNNGSAIEFQPPDVHQAERFVTDLLERLAGSDFSACFPECATVCTIHHHGQLWWQSDRAGLVDDLRRLVQADAK